MHINETTAIRSNGNCTSIAMICHFGFLWHLQTMFSQDNWTELLTLTLYPVEIGELLMKALVAGDLHVTACFSGMSEVILWA